MGPSIALGADLLYTEKVQTPNRRVVIVFFISLNLFSGFVFAQEELPFWQKKTRLYDQILNKRRIVVSVQKQTTTEGELRYRMVGAGLVAAPLSFVRNEIGQFENLNKVSSHFKKVVHDKNKSQLHLNIEAAGYQTRLTMNYKWTRPSQDFEQMDWQVIEGTFEGMQGHYKLKSLGPQKTEVSTWTLLPEPRVPIPSFLLNFTLEVISEKVAQKMRSYLEEEYQKSRNHERK